MPDCVRFGVEREGEARKPAHLRVAATPPSFFDEDEHAKFGVAPLQLQELGVLLADRLEQVAVAAPVLAHLHPYALEVDRLGGFNLHGCPFLSRLGSWLKLREQPAPPCFV